MIGVSIAGLSFLIWVYLLLGRGRFWQVSTVSIERKPRLMSAPRVAVIVPARNEADVVGLAVRSLLEQDYAGRVHVFVVDDHSSDETVNLVRQAAASKSEQLTIGSAMPLPAGWKGK